MAKTEAVAKRNLMRMGFDWRAWRRLPPVEQAARKRGATLVYFPPEKGDRDPTNVRMSLLNYFWPLEDGSSCSHCGKSREEHGISQPWLAIRDAHVNEDIRSWLCRLNKGEADFFTYE